MTSPYSACAELVRQLHLAIRQLESQAAAMQTSPLAGREWFELLTRKLVPQLTDDAFLVVGVVGGTNIGKSVIFNHLAGCRASATSPFASGTKHPVCLVPPGFEQHHDLASIFRGFDLHPWSEASAALEDHPEHRLFWRTNETTPSNLLILDTPDIDGDVRVNWERADNIRRCADVLVAVLTQQKYNDAAVKQFFRKAAEEDKVVLVVFNQVLLPDDEEYWPIWLRTFCQETGVSPEFVYVAPADRRAAEENRLPFYLRDWPVPSGITNPKRERGQTLQNAPNSETACHVSSEVTHGVLEASALAGASGYIDVPHDLKTDLSALHFSSIKLRTLLGSLRTVLSEQAGLPAYLREVRSRSDEFRTASALLSTHELAESREWPPVPNPVVVQEVRNWWQSQREGWTKTVHNFYNAVGRGMLKPFASLRDRLQGERVPPLEQYRQREWQTILDTVEKVYERLQWFSELGNPLLQPRIDRLLNGKSRVDMLELLKTRHDLTDLEFEVRNLVSAEMEAFRQESPQSFQLMKWIDHGAAAVRPVTSVCLFVTGFGPAGHAVQSVAANAAVQFAVDIASGTVTAVAGEKALSETAATGAGLFEAWFRRLHARFAAKRAAWLGRMLKDHLFGTLPDELQAAIDIPQSDTFRSVQRSIEQLQKEMTAAEV